MIETLQRIIESSFERLSAQAATDLPLVLAAVVILVSAYVLARLARWLTARAFKGIRTDRWLRRSGVYSIIDRSGSLRASRAMAQTVYWIVLGIGLVTAMNVFGAGPVSRVVDDVVNLIPRLVAAAAIIVGGLWLGQYLGRSTLVWAVNEDLPAPRRIAVGVRTLVIFAAVVVAADTIDFAASVFLAGFVLILGGLVLAAALAFGLGARDVVKQRLAGKFAEESEEVHERSLWHHL